MRKLRIRMGVDRQQPADPRMVRKLRGIARGSSVAGPRPPAASRARVARSGAPGGPARGILTPRPRPRSFPSRPRQETKGGEPFIAAGRLSRLRDHAAVTIAVTAGPSGRSPRPGPGGERPRARHVDMTLRLAPGAASNCSGVASARTAFSDARRLSTPSSARVGSGTSAESAGVFLGRPRCTRRTGSPRGPRPTRRAAAGERAGCPRPRWPCTIATAWRWRSACGGAA
jgi:hypothetical protein